MTIFNHIKDIHYKIILLILLLLAYSNSLHNGFLLDDYTLFVDSDALKNVSWSDLWTAPFNDFYRPGAYALHKLTLLIFGTNVVGYHLLNLALFYIAGLLFFILVRRLSGNSETAFWSSSLWMLHPINNFLINYCTANVLTLNIIAMLACTLAFLKYAQNRNALFYVLSLLFYGFSLLSHEISFILPVYIGLIALFFFKFKLNDILRMLAGYGAVFFLYLIIRLSLLPPPSLLSAASSLAQKITAFCSLMAWYLSKLLWPFDIIFLWNVPIEAHPSLNPTTIVVTVFIILALLTAVQMGRTIYSFSIAMFLISLVPVFCAAFSYPQTKTALLEPHWLAFSSIWLFFLLASLLTRLRSTISFKSWALLAVLLLSALIGLTRHHNQFWINDNTYCGYWLGLNKHNYEPYHCQARVFLRTYDRGLNIDQYKDCKVISDVAWAYNIKNTKTLPDDPAQQQKLISYYRMAIEKDARCAPAYYGLGLYYGNTLENRAEAEKNFANENCNHKCDK